MKNNRSNFYGLDSPFDASKAKFFEPPPKKSPSFQSNNFAGVGAFSSPEVGGMGRRLELSRATLMNPRDRVQGNFEYNIISGSFRRRV